MPARTSPEKPNPPKDKTSFITWEGRNIPMEWQPSGWRLRSRSKHCTVDYSTNVLSLAQAKVKAKKHLEAEKEKAEKKASKGTTLEDVVKVYRSLPKRAGEVTAYSCISHLRSAVRVVTGKELDQVQVGSIDSKFWLAYIAKRQGRDSADLSTRDKINAAINTVMRNAAGVFKKTLRPLYADQGIKFNDDVSTIQFLEVPKLPKPPADDAAMLAALPQLKQDDFEVWKCICAARFAGLRRKEITHLAKSWVEVDGPATYIRLRDRPEEGFRNKTGRMYRALVINEEFAAFLRSAPEGLIITPDLRRKKKYLEVKMRSRFYWFYFEPQTWAKKFTKDAPNALHRLRGLYLDAVAKLTEDAVKARLEGIKAAAENAGHTSTKTTQDHYLSEG